jgi:hypothetical protein
MGSPSFSEKIDSVANTPTDATEEEMNGRRGGPPPDVIARAVGIAIGSPEFQRR